MFFFRNYIDNKIYTYVNFNFLAKYRKRVNNLSEYPMTCPVEFRKTDITVGNCTIVFKKNKHI
jgi:hypothetical protein